MPKPFALGPFNLDLMLYDAALNERSAPTRRMLANAVLNMEPGEAYYGAEQLLQAIEAVHDEMDLGKCQLAQILARNGDDYQRCLYYMLAGRGVVQMLDDLRWLVGLLRTRYDQLVECRQKGIRVVYSPGAYLASEPDGVLPANDADFRLGASWLNDPMLSLLNEDEDPS